MRTSDQAHAQSRSAFGIAILVVPLACAFWFVATSLVKQWVDDPNYTHGLFVIPMAVLLAWRRRKRLAEIPPEESYLGFAVLATGGLIYMLGIAAAELLTMRFSLVVTVFGLVLLTQGWGRTRELMFPLLFLLLMIPIPYILYYKMTFPLQLESSKITAALLTSLGMPVVRTGNVIHLEGYTLEIVTACSGLRSMMTLGTLAIFMTEFFRFGKIGNVLFVALSIPVAVMANTTRLVLTAGISAIAGPETADSFLHELSGIVVFLAGLVMLAILAGLIEWIAKRRRVS